MYVGTCDYVCIVTDLSQFIYVRTCVLQNFSVHSWANEITFSFFDAHIFVAQCVLYNDIYCILTVYSTFQAVHVHISTVHIMAALFLPLKAFYVQWTLFTAAVTTLAFFGASVITLLTIACSPQEY